MLELIIVIGYFIAMVCLGVITRRQTLNADNFFVAGRKGSTLYTTGSLFSTIVGGSATIGMAGLAFSRGLTGAWWLLAGAIGLIFLGILFAKKVRGFGLYTLPGLIEKQYGRTAALAASTLISVAWLGVIAGQILAAGKIMSVLGTGSPTFWMLIFTGVFTLYTVVGGQWAVIKTDTWQAGIIYAGIFSAFAVVLAKFGGFGGLWKGLPAGFSSFPVGPKFGTYDLVKTLLLVGLPYVVGPDMYTRLFSARDARTAQKSVYLTSLLLVPLTAVIVLLGMSAAVLFPGIAPEQAFPTIITQTLPPFVDGLVLAALLAAVMSSADTCLMSVGTIVAVDVAKKVRPSMTERQTLLVSRIAIIVVGLLSLGLALFLKGVISSLLFAYTVYTAGVIPLVIAGFYKDRLKVTPTAALVALVGGGATGLTSQLLKIRYLDLCALGVSVALLFLVSAVENAVRAGSRQPVART